MNDNFRIYYTSSGFTSVGKINKHDNFYEINYCLNGTNTYHLPDTKQQYSLRSREILLINKNTRHIYNSEKKYEVCSLLFTREFIGYSLPEAFFNFDFLSIFADNPLFNLSKDIFNRTRIENLIKKLLQEKRQDVFSALRVRNAITEILILLHNTKITADDKFSKTNVISRIAGYVENNFFEDINLHSLAAQYSINYPYLSSIFSKQMGISFNKYLNRIRLEKCAEVLKKQNVSISAACFECGFNDLANFYRSFKCYFGISPLKYKKQYCRKT
ncbi:MAG: hypothetical protein A2096_10475 [Spirochaetes bacterium GWF1_41_5]|nr:MAG: hypothetical protein A2096_10475 [Spirochaetes bacterium GWF1_41_5]